MINGRCVGGWVRCVVLALLVVPWSALAQSGSGEGPRIRRSGDKLPRGERRALSSRDPREMVKKVRELRESVKERLTLSAESEIEVGTLFDTHLKKIEELATDDSETARAEARVKVEELRERMEKARDEQNREEARRIREEIRELRDGFGGVPMEVSIEFVKAVEKELDKKQAKAFRKMATELGIVRMPLRNGGSRFREMLRLLRDPEIGLDQEAQQEIRELIRNKTNEMRDNSEERPSREERMKLIKELKEAIMGKLTAQQRQKLEEKLAQTEEEQGERSVRESRRGKRGRGSTANGSEGDPVRP